MKWVNNEMGQFSEECKMTEGKGTARRAAEQRGKQARGEQQTIYNEILQLKTSV
jgi:hypothetical protein